MQNSFSGGLLHPQPNPETTAWRIFHDPESGVWTDHFEGRWLVQTGDEDFPKWIEAAAENDPSTKSVYWRPRDRSAKSSPVRQWGEAVEAPFWIKENGAKFLVDFAAGYSVGIFLDQRENRRETERRSFPGATVLNAFAYTGGFSVMAARAGAVTTTLDLSGTYLDWAWKNFAENGLDPKEHHGCKGDAFEWLGAFARQGRKFDGVILDPPTFSRIKKGGAFRSDHDYARLACLAAKVVRRGGWMLCCCNTHRLSEKKFCGLVKRGVAETNRRMTNLQCKPMPPEFRGDDYLKSLWFDVE